MDVMELMAFFDAMVKGAEVTALCACSNEQGQIFQPEAYLKKGEKILTLQREQKRRILKSTLFAQAGLTEKGFHKSKFSAFSYIRQGIATKVYFPLLREVNEAYFQWKEEEEVEKWQDIVAPLSTWIHPDIKKHLQFETPQRYQQEVLQAMRRKESEKNNLGLLVTTPRGSFMAPTGVRVTRRHDGGKWGIRGTNESLHTRVLDLCNQLAYYAMVSHFLWYLEEKKEWEEDRVYGVLKKEEERLSSYNKGVLTFYNEEQRRYPSLLLHYEEQNKEHYRSLEEGTKNPKGWILAQYLLYLREHIEEVAFLEGMEYEFSPYFDMILKEYFKDVQSEKYYRTLSLTRAAVWQTKKNIPEKVVESMESSHFNDYFGYVEFDEQCDLQKLEELEKEFRALQSIFKQNKHETHALRFRKLGNHHATGLYFPHLHCLCVDLRCPSSMVHEYFHLLDFTNASSSRKDSFQEVEDFYRIGFAKMEEELLKGSALEKQLSGSSKYNREYYFEPTEIFARCGEIYLTRILGVENSLCKQEEGFAYPDTTELNEAITTYFHEFLNKEEKIA